MGISELVRVVGLEPTSLAALEPKSSMFTNFIIPAYRSGRSSAAIFSLLLYLRRIRIHRV